MLRSSLRSANRRTARSLEVTPPSLNTGWLNRLVVIIGTVTPVSARTFFNRSIWLLRSASVASNGIQVVVVEGQAVRADLGQLLDRLDHVERLPARAAELVLADPADGPQTEGELVGRSGGEAHGGASVGSTRGNVDVQQHIGAIAPVKGGICARVTDVQVLIATTNARGAPMSSPRRVGGCDGASARRHNLSRLLTLVHREGPQPRSALTRRTGLNRSTIAGLVGELVAARPGHRDRSDRLHRRRSTESAGRGRPLGGGADGQPRHRRRDASVWSVWAARCTSGSAIPPVGSLTATEAVNLVAALVAGMRSELDSRFRVLGVGVAVPGLVERSTGTVTLAPHLQLARRAARRPDHGGHRLPLRGGQRRPGRAGGRAVVRGRPGSAATSSTSTAAPAGSAAASSAAAGRCWVGTGTPASSATAWSTRPGRRCHCGRTGCLETEVTP